MSSHRVDQAEYLPLVTLVDTNVLLDIATNNHEWAPWSSAALAQVHDDGRAAINPIIYAEISVGYDSVEVLDGALPSDDFLREPLPYAAGFLAGKAFRSYRRRGGAKTSPIADFYIGAHAAVRGYRLLTRDPQRYRSYFPTVHLITPEP